MASTGNFGATLLASQWYDTASRFSYASAYQGAIKPSGGISRNIVGVIAIPSLASVDWSQRLISAAVITMEVETYRYGVLRLYRSRRSSYENIAGLNYVDEAGGYTDIRLDVGGLGTQRATLSAENIAWLLQQLQAGYTWFCAYQPGEVAEQYYSRKVLGFTAFTLTLTYDYSASRITSAPNTDIGEAMTVTWQNYSDVFTRKIRFVLGSEDSGQIDAPGTAYTYTLPDSWLAQIPNAESAAATVYLYTYNGAALLGTDAKTFSARVPASIVPTLSGFAAAPSNDNPTVDGWGVWLQGYSKGAFSASAVPGTGANIAGYTLTGGGISSDITSASGEYAYVSGIINASGNVVFTLTAKDTRGRTASASITVAVESYSAPAATEIAAIRCDENGVQDFTSGTYLSAFARFSWSSVGGKNVLTKEVRYKRAEETTYTVGLTDISSGSWSAAFGGGTIAEGAAYDVQLYIVDALGNAASITAGVQSVLGFHIGFRNDRARFGGVSQKPGLQVDWDTDILGGLDVGRDVTVGGSITAAAVNVPFERIPFTPSAGTSVAVWDGCWYAKIGNIVYIHLGIQGLTANDPAYPFVMPEGFRPVTAYATGGAGGGNLGQFSNMYIATNGQIRLLTQSTSAIIDGCYIASE